MKRLCLFFAVAIISLVAVVVLIPKHVNADVNDFHFSSFDADYYLSKDDEGRSTLRVVERLTAEFVNVDQNRGIERAIPKFYDGHSVSFKFESMKRNGIPEQLYEQRDDGAFTILSTRRDDYVNGTQEYTFTYTLRDVTKDFGDHQEFYWDTNGTGWAQTFDNVTARVHLDDSIYAGFTGAVSCYQGVEGSNSSCPYKSDGKEVSFSSAGLIGAGGNLTVNLSFNSGTFINYKFTILDLVPYAFLLIAAVLFMIAIVIKIKYGRDHPGRGTIVPEYLPPKGVSVLQSAEISGKIGPSSTAQILDLAVRHKIKIIESKKKVLMFDQTVYTLELVNIDGLVGEELGFVEIMFGSKETGTQYVMSRTDTTKALLMQSMIKSIKEESQAVGYRLKQQKQTIIQVSIMTMMFLFFVITVFFFANSIRPEVVFGGFVLVFVVSLAAIVFKMFDLRPLTQKGREVFDYLKGLEMYIKLAEADRIKVLQSPSGAEKRSIHTDDPANLVVLYERVLPYAVLFGQEKEWLKQLGTYYESASTTPGWYSGTGTFNAAVFASSINSFSSYSNSSSSSSSSGAGGGGSSGGGGGGGGGGGV